ncbi:MAG: sulfite exporter TauE/SafE family protein [Chitinophagales bacterium]
MVQVFNKYKFYLLFVGFVLLLWILNVDFESIDLRISGIMAFASFVAGGSSEGGGAFAFVPMTLWLKVHPVVAKFFSLMIQSVGMTAASIYIFCSKRVQLDINCIFRISIGGLLGALVCIFVLQGVFNAKQLKVFFVSLFLAFAIIISIFKLQNVRLVASVDKWDDYLILPAIGFVGGVVSNWIGNGIDIICYIVLVLYYRMDIRTATSMSIVLMAIQSVISFACFLMLGNLPEEVIGMWMSAVPIVVFGAPFGAYFVTRVSNELIASFLKFVIVLQFIAVYVVLDFSLSLYLLSVGTIVGALFLFFALYIVSPFRMKKAKF